MIDQPSTTPDIDPAGKSRRRLLRANLRAARRAFGKALPARLRSSLQGNTHKFGFSLDMGELQILNGSCYVTHAGLLRLALRRKCRGMQVEAVEALCDAAAGRYVMKATVFPSRDSLGFVGYGDADPANVSPLVRGAELRIAETRAINRALRKAYGIGLCSAEEIASSALSERPADAGEINNASGRNGNGSHRRVRDRLCQIIRQHQLDAKQVKAYAVDYCGSTSLSAASRERIEAFVEQLAVRAATDRLGLVCQLNSYPAQPAGS